MMDASTMQSMPSVAQIFMKEMHQEINSLKTELDLVKLQNNALKHEVESLQLRNRALFMENAQLKSQVQNEQTTSMSFARENFENYTSVQDERTDTGFNFCTEMEEDIKPNLEQLNRSLQNLTKEASNELCETANCEPHSQPAFPGIAEPELSRPNEGTNNMITASSKLYEIESATMEEERDIKPNVQALNKQILASNDGAGNLHLNVMESNRGVKLPPTVDDSTRQQATGDGKLHTSKSSPVGGHLAERLKMLLERRSTLSNSLSANGLENIKGASAIAPEPDRISGGHILDVHNTPNQVIKTLLGTAALSEDTNERSKLPAFKPTAGFPCLYCPEVFGTKWKLAVHNRSHKYDKPAVTNIDKTLTQLLKQSTAGQGGSSPLNFPYPKTLFPCPYCFLNFETIWKRAVHKRSHKSDTQIRPETPFRDICVDSSTMFNMPNVQTNRQSAEAILTNLPTEHNSIPTNQTKGGSSLQTEPHILNVRSLSENRDEETDSQPMLSSSSNSNYDSPSRNIGSESHSMVTNTIPCIPADSCIANNNSDNDSEMIALSNDTTECLICLLVFNTKAELDEHYMTNHNYSCSPLGEFCCLFCSENLQADPMKLLTHRQNCKKAKKSSRKPKMKNTSKREAGAATKYDLLSETGLTSGNKDVKEEDTYIKSEVALNASPLLANILLTRGAENRNDAVGDTSKRVTKNINQMGLVEASTESEGMTSVDSDLTDDEDNDPDFTIRTTKRTPKKEDSQDSATDEHTCKHCSLTLPSAWKLAIHYRSCKESDTLICPDCSQPFETKMKLRAHWQREHEVFKCSYCSQIFESKWKLSVHQRSQKRMKKIYGPDADLGPACCIQGGKHYAVAQVGSSTSLYGNPNAPADLPLGSQEFNLSDAKKSLHICCICNATFTEYAWLQEHYRSKHSDFEVCGAEQYSPAVDLGAQKAGGKNEEDIISQIVGMIQNVVDSGPQVLGEMPNVSSDNGIKDGAPVPVQTSSNTVNGDTVFEKDTLKINQIDAPIEDTNSLVKVGSLQTVLTGTTSNVIRDVDSNEKLNRNKTNVLGCSHCPKSFSSKWKLDLHRAVHNRLKPYHCNICKRKFSIKSSLSVHEKLHTGGIPFTCKTCGISFARWMLLKQHEKLHKRCLSCHKRLTRVRGAYCTKHNPIKKQSRKKSRKSRVKFYSAVYNVH